MYTGLFVSCADRFLFSLSQDNQTITVGRLYCRCGWHCYLTLACRTLSDLQTPTHLLISGNETSKINNQNTLTFFISNRWVNINRLFHHDFASIEPIRLWTQNCTFLSNVTEDYKSIFHFCTRKTNLFVTPFSRKPQDLHMYKLFSFLTWNFLPMEMLWSRNT